MLEPRARRSELATPASSERMCEKSAGSGADLVFLDLEDACAPVAKEAARAHRRGRAHQARLGPHGPGRADQRPRHAVVPRRHHRGRHRRRVTPSTSSSCPKARSARDVWWVDVLLTQLETKLGLSRPIGLEVLIEEAEGLANAAEIARSSARLEAIIFGAGDLSASLHARVDGNFDPSTTTPATSGTSPGSRCSPRRGARASTPSTRPTRPTRIPRGTAGRPCTPACSASTASGRSTPTRSPIANEVFAPTADEIEEATEAIEIYRAVRGRGGWGRSVATAGWSTPPTCASAANVLAQGRARLADEGGQR